jgi:hypothetical protein
MAWSLAWQGGGVFVDFSAGRSLGEQELRANGSDSNGLFSRRPTMARQVLIETKRGLELFCLSPNFRLTG